MRFLFLFLPFLGFSQSLIQIGTVPGICTDIVVEPNKLLVSCKQGVLYEWTLQGIDTLAVLPVKTDGESGLLGVTKIGSGIYLSYVDLNFDQQVVKLGGDTLITIEAETNFPNHRGGDLETDGEHIFFTVGEGLGGNGAIYMLDTLGNILTQANGLRNPWKIDYHNGGLWITDVGDQDREEVNFTSVNGLDGLNFNWPCFEGTVQLGPDTCGGVDPYFEYPRVGGTAIIGGYYKNNFIFADHYDAALYILRNGQVDTLPGVKYLTVINDGYAADYSGKIYELSFTTFGEDYIEFTGEYVCEYDSLNPFLSYRLDVQFVNGTDTVVVPGYFAGDGNAANTSAKCGDKWRVHFNASGTWDYQVFFSRGVNVAITQHSTDTIPPNGETGTVEFSGGRLLKYVGKRYRQWSDGEWFLKFGTDSPETLLAYRDFDGTYYQGTGGQQTLHDYSEHVQDWTNGDPVWKDTLGKGLIGAINYLSSQGQNAYSCVAMNINGDGRNCWPFVSHDTLNRIDVSKLEQWRIVLEHGGDKGLHWQVKFSELENHTLLNTTNWKIMLREFVARFAHLPAVTWNLGEEFFFQGFNEHMINKSTYLREIDPYGHIIVFHNLTVAAFVFNNQTVRNYLDGASLQIGQPVWTDSIVTEIISFNNDTAFIVNNDEQGPSEYGVPADDDALPQTQEQIRQLNQYPAFFGGCEGWEAYFGYQTSCTDLDCDNFRSRENVWYTNRGIRQVMESIAFQYGRPRHDLVDTGYCFGNGIEFLVYSTNHPVTVSLSGQWLVRYFDVQNQTWTPDEEFTGTVNAPYEFVARLVQDDIVGINVLRFDVFIRDCEAELFYNVSVPGTLYYGDGDTWTILAQVLGEGRITHPASPYYQLVAGDTTLLRAGGNCEKCYQVLNNGIEIHCDVLIYTIDGRLVGSFSKGFVSLPTGSYIIQSSVEVIK